MEQEPVPKHQRVPVPQSIQAEVVNACMRRCCLCYYLHDERRVRKGQIAHLNRNRSDPDFPNLVFLCLEHHDEFDSQTSQSKGLIPQEVKVYRDRLYRELDRPSSTSKQKIAPPPADDPVEKLAPALREAIRREPGRYDYLLTPWRLTAWQDVPSFLFAYKSSNRIDGICRIERIFLRDGRVAIICIQIPHNPGMSITNTVETIAFQVCHQFKIDPINLVWIEHYMPGIFRVNEWSLVSFQSFPPKSMFLGPTWRVMTDDDWRDLGLRPRKSNK